MTEYFLAEFFFPDFFFQNFFFPDFFFFFFFFGLQNRGAPYTQVRLIHGDLRYILFAIISYDMFRCLLFYKLHVFFQVSFHLLFTNVCIYDSLYMFLHCRMINK